MLSWPPATMQSASPALIAWAPSITAFRPEPQTLLIVSAPTCGSMPALICACRAGACPCPPWTTWPMITSSTRSPGTWARFMASRIAAAPRSDALSVESPPRNLPIGVRAAPTMKTSGVLLIGKPHENGVAGATWPGRKCRNERILHERRARGTRASARAAQAAGVVVAVELHAGPLCDPRPQRERPVRVVDGRRERVPPAAAARHQLPAHVTVGVLRARELEGERLELVRPRAPEHRAPAHELVRGEVQRLARGQEPRGRVQAQARRRAHEQRADDELHARLLADHGHEAREQRHAQQADPEADRSARPRLRRERELTTVVADRDEVGDRRFVRR